MSGYGIALFPQHVALLEGSGIPSDLARARNYQSVDTKKRLEDLGITRAGRRIPGLLIPMLRKDKSVWGYQYRPDGPRTRDGKPAKYETPTGQRNGIDVPPGVGPMLDDPTVPLLVTEGTRKADCAAARGLACVALPGVWSWRGTNERGGKTAVADWQDVALNGRRVVLAFDSDVMVKPAVALAMKTLAHYMESKGAKVEFLHLPDDEPGKTGLDDWLSGRETAELWTLVRPDPPAVKAPEPEQDTSPKTAPDGSDGSGRIPRGTVQGDSLFDDVHAFLSRFLVLPDEHAAAAVTAWVIHTHALDAFDSTPRLAFLSPEPGSGKSRAQEVAETLTPNPLRTSNVSSALLFRLIHENRPTVFMDEVDTVWTAKGQAEDLRALVNAGHRRGSDAARMVGEGAGMKAQTFRQFAAVCVAGLGDLPGTIADRSVIVRMKRRRVDEQVEPWRFRTCEPQGHQLRERIAAWVRDEADALAEHQPDPVGDVTDRAWDVWEPLLVVADVAGGRWPDVLREACRAMTGQEPGPASAGLRLLDDVRTVWVDGETFVGSSVLVARLVSLEEAPWGTEPLLTPKRLAYLLKRYGIHPQHAAGDKSHRGYYRDAFSDPWSRYLPAVDGERANDDAGSGDGRELLEHSTSVQTSLDTLPLQNRPDPSDPSEPRDTSHHQDDVVDLDEVLEHHDDEHLVDEHLVQEHRPAVPLHGCAGPACRVPGCPEAVAS